MDDVRDFEVCHSLEFLTSVYEKVADMQKISYRVSLVLLLILGFYFTGSGMSFYFLRQIEPGHWDWLTFDKEILDYLFVTWRFLGLLSVSFGLTTFFLTLTALRQGNKYAYYFMWIWPVFLLLYTSTVHTYLAFIGFPIVLLLTTSLFLSRKRYHS